MAIKNKSQDKMNKSPPIGVIAPKVFIPVKAIRYRLPENRNIPAVMNHPEIERMGCEKSVKAKATAKSPKAW